ncbi:splicing factor 3A subunit 2-like [Balaenoptera musculus]|uniref:Splicing factor 3A subunit 2-like n=1 Tax=Balaenoptera musculus TaxID=9771 RepID=A0A8B8VR16_BALMU|nr:splicing factor 3A subunit 2-like [Balaenoptera musculus]
MVQENSNQSNKELWRSCESKMSENAHPDQNVSSKAEAVLPATKVLLPSIPAMLPPTKVLLPPTKVLLPPTKVLLPRTPAMLPTTKVLLPPTSAVLSPSAAMLPPSKVLLPLTKAVLNSTSAHQTALPASTQGQGALCPKVPTPSAVPEVQAEVNPRHGPEAKLPAEQRP